MKHFWVGVVLFLAGCGSGSQSAVPAYTDADRARDIQTNGMVCVILAICAVLLIKAAFDLFSTMKKTPEKIVIRKKEGPPAGPANPVTPEEPGTAEEIEDDRP